MFKKLLPLLLLSFLSVAQVANANRFDPYYMTLVSDYGNTIFTNHNVSNSYVDHPFYQRANEDFNFRQTVNAWAGSMIAQHMALEMSQYLQAINAHPLLLNETDSVRLIGLIASFPEPPVPHFLLEYWAHTKIGRDDWLRIFLSLKQNAEAIRSGSVQKALPSPEGQSKASPQVDALVKKMLTPFEDYRELISLPEIVDQDALEDIEVAVNSKEIASAVIIGKRGSGKTHLLWGAGEALSKKGNSPVYVLNVGSLEGHKEAQNRGGVEQYFEALKQFLIASKDNPPIILVDEIQLLRGVGTAKGKSSDFFDYLKQMMTSGLVRLVGTTTLKEYNAYFSGDEALSDRLTKIYHKEPTGKELENILISYTSGRQGVEIKNSRSFVKMVVQYSEEFLIVASEPRRSANLIDKTFSRLRAKGIDAGSLNKTQLENEIQQTLVKNFNVRTHMFSSSYKKKLLEGLKPYLDGAIVGQKDLISSFINDFALYLAGGNNKPTKILLAGPPGQGKTLFAKTIARYRGGHFALIDMASITSIEEFQQKMHEALVEDPFATILLDEIEKAPIALQNSILTMFEEGRFTLTKTLNQSSGTMSSIEIDISKALIFSASNAGSEKIKMLSTERAPEEKMSIGFIQQDLSTNSQAGVASLSSAQIRSLLEQEQYNNRPALSPPFIDRMKIYLIEPAEEVEFKEIVRRQLAAVIQSFEANNKVSVEFEANMQTKWINSISKGFVKGQVSNREAERLINDQIIGPLAAFVLLNNINRRSAIEVKITKSGEISLGVVEKSCLKSLL